MPCGCPAAFLVSLKSAYQSAVAILGQIWVSKSLRVVKQETHRVEMRRAELASRCAECPFPWFLAARPPSFRQAQDLAYVTTPQIQRFDAAVGGDSAASQASPLRWYQIKFYGTVDWAISDTDTTGRGPPQNKIYKTRGAAGSSSTDDMRLAGLAFLVSLSHSAAFLSPLDVRHASIKLQNRAAFVPVGARAAPTLRRGRALPQQPTAMGQMMQGEGETDKPVMSPFVTPALGAEETREWIWRGYRIRLSTPWSRWDAVRASARKKIFR